MKDTLKKSESIVTVVLLTYNSSKYIDKCLKSIERQSFDNFDVLIVDNNSKDDSIDKVNTFMGNPHFKILANDENLGWAGGNNYAIKNIKTKYAVLLNIDTIVHEDWLKNLVEFAESKENLGAASSSILELKDYPKVTEGFPLHFELDKGLITSAQRTNENVEVSFVPGTAMLLNLPALGKEAYFRDDFFMYHEDVEFSLRVSNKYQLYYCGDSIAWHDSKQSFSNPRTCKLAIKNLFTCLVEYQSSRDFYKNYFSYLKSYLKYFSFYSRFYPVLYTYYFLKYWFLAGFKKLSYDKNQKQAIKTNKLNEHYLNGKKREFSFIF